MKQLNLFNASGLACSNETPSSFSSEPAKVMARFRLVDQVFLVSNCRESLCSEAPQISFLASSRSFVPSPSLLLSSIFLPDPPRLVLLSLFTGSRKRLGNPFSFRAFGWRCSLFCPLNSIHSLTCPISRKKTIHWLSALSYGSRQ